MLDWILFVVNEFRKAPPDAFAGAVFGAISVGVGWFIHSRKHAGDTERVARLTQENADLRVRLRDTEEELRITRRERDELRAKLEDAQGRITELERLEDGLRRRISQLTDGLEKAKEEDLVVHAELGERDKRVADLEVENADLLKRLDSASKQLEWLEQCDGSLWERGVEPTDDVRWEPSTERRARLLSIFNLKGGVGKTTITTNLGATLAELGQRVLLVDLDYQGSMTRLLVGGYQMKDIYENQLVVVGSSETTPMRKPLAG